MFGFFCINFSVESMFEFELKHTLNLYGAVGY